MKAVLRVAVGLGVLYVLCILFPQPFFQHRAVSGNIVLFSDSVPPTGLLPGVQALLSRSPLYDPRVRQRVFLCSSRWGFSFFARGRTDLAGICDDRLTGNVFIRPADLGAGRLLGMQGLVDPRPLSYFIAHEITHNMEARYVGRWDLRVPTWLWEGYADYIGGGKSLEAYLAGPLLMPYDRYALYVAYLLEGEHRDIRDLLDHPPAIDSVERLVH